MDELYIDRLPQAGAAPTQSPQLRCSPRLAKRLLKET